MIAIARRAEEDAPAKLETIAEDTGLTVPYLSQIAISLRRARLLRGLSGRGGGYLLGRPPEDITLGEIIEASIGPINVVDCVCDPEMCAKAHRCESRLIYVLLNRSIKRVLNGYTLADLSDLDRLEQVIRDLSDEETEALTATTPFVCASRRSTSRAGC
jgi:Rrf2 family protein